MAKILIAGDYCPYARINKLVENEEYHDIFKDITEYTYTSDYSIVNLEVPIVNGDALPIKKCGPNLKSSSKALDAIKYAGFDLLTLANNHIYDYGEKGIYTTLEECKNKKIETVGAGKNISEASQILYKEINGCIFAFINCCEHEFSIASSTTGGANPLNPIKQFYDIQEAKVHSDRIIVIIHGGHEHYQLPSPRMKETYHFFIDAGADVIVNHHQHCYSGFEIYKDRPIFYGLGNFCFDWDNKRQMPWNEGIMLQLEVDKNKIDFELIPFTQGDKSAGVVIMQDTESFYKQISVLNKIISDDSLLNNNYTEYLNKGKQFFDYCLEPYSNRLLVKLYNRGIIPSLYPTSKIPVIENMIVCESHRDRLMYYLKTRREND